MKSGIIYRAHNIKNNKSYIGQTISVLSDRISGHLSVAKRCKTKFACALNKYGKDSWVWEILCQNVPFSQLNALEMMYIVLFDSFDNGYNSTCGGEQSPTTNQETAIIAGINSGNARRGLLRGPHTKETKDKISKKLIGRKIGPFSEEHCRKLALSKFGDKNPMKRKDVAKKVSEKNKGHENNSKRYKVFLPDGSIEIILNLSKFCRKNGLSSGSMHQVLTSKRKHHKGYKIEKF